MQYDVLVIGGGAGGLTVARGLASSEKKILLVSAGPLGGDCTHTGCVPSKALISYAHRHPGAGRADAYRYLATKREQIYATETSELLEREDIEVRTGVASFTTPHTIEVDGIVYYGRHIVLATGSRPRLLTIDSDESVPLLTTDQLFYNTGSLQRVVVVGGGFVSVELAGALQRLGIEVTVVHRGESILPHEEPEVQQSVTASLRELGVQFMFAAHLSRIHQGSVVIDDQAHRVPTMVAADAVIVAIGREPDITNLNVDAAGIATTDAGIVTNTYHQTSQPHIYAIGDCVADSPHFTHRANTQGRAVIQSLRLPWYKKTTIPATCPYTIYAPVPVARLGKTRAQLDMIYGEDGYHTLMLHTTHDDKTIITDATPGMIIVHASHIRQRILGVTIVDPHADELLALFVYIYHHQHSLLRLIYVTFPYPSHSMVIKKIADEALRYLSLTWRASLARWVRRHSGLFVGLSIWMTMLVILLLAMHYYESDWTMVVRWLVGVLELPVWGSLIFIGLYTIRPLIFIPGSLMTIIAGMVFGRWGIILSLIGAVTSGLLAYIVGNMLGSSFINKQTPGVLSVLARAVRSSRVFYRLLLVRLIGLPFDPISFGAGVLGAPLLVFLVTTLLGSVPGGIGLVMIGASITDLEELLRGEWQSSVQYDVLLWGVLFFFITMMIGRLLRRFGKK